jgi:hypothetical protein
MPEEDQNYFTSLVERIEQSNHIQETSSELLQFHVEDILGLAQIKAGKF